MFNSKPWRSEVALGVVVFYTVLGRLILQKQRGSKEVCVWVESADEAKLGLSEVSGWQCQASADNQRWLYRHPASGTDMVLRLAAIRHACGILDKRGEEGWCNPKCPAWVQGLMIKAPSSAS